MIIYQRKEKQQEHRNWSTNHKDSGEIKEYEILRSPGSGASLLKTGQVYNYCAMRGICLLNRAISPTFLPLYPRHSRVSAASTQVTQLLLASQPLPQPPTPPERPPPAYARVIFKRVAALNSDHGPVLGRLVLCLGFLVLYILWAKLSYFGI
jgi:hypothetical protein